MSVTNYSPEKCRYAIDKLVNAVYLVSENAVKDIRVDNGAAYVNSISETPIKLECYGLTLSEEESLDERYKFIHTLKFSVNGYANKDDFQGRYYVIVRDYEGTWWLVNPLFPCKAAYTYTLGYQQNHTEFNIGTASNHPVLKLNGMSDTSSYQCNEYWLSGIDKLWLNEKKYSVHSGSSIKYTNDGFKEVEYNKSSAVFTESFDGENTSHQIDFDVLFSDYKSSWHYNLLEFKDNLYAAIIKTIDGKYALCGFSFGLQPGYTVSADDTVTTGNKIQITLQDAHDAGDAIEMFDNISPIPVSSTTWEYTSEHDGYECVGDGVAKYLLQKEIDALGNETGNYKALEGYENDFPGLNIVGTFDSVVTFANTYCTGGGCNINMSFPSTLTFNNIGCQTYYVKADSSWSISSSVDYITVNPSSGASNVGYVVEVCNTLQPTSASQNSTIEISYCITSSTVDVSVVQYSGCFPQGLSYNVPANATVLTIPTQCCVQSVRETTNIGATIVVYDSYIQVTIPENNTGKYRTITLLVVYCDGSSTNIIITQDNVFKEWRDGSEDPFCIESDKYKIQYLWTGTTSTSYVKTNTTRNVLVERYSADCMSSRWVRTDTTICIDNSTPSPATSADYLTFVALERSSFWFSGTTTANTVDYSLDNGSTWTTLSGGSYTPYVPTGSKILWKGNMTPNTNGVGRFYSTGNFNAEGNVMSLLFGDNYAGQTSLSGKANAFKYLFSKPTSITSTFFYNNVVNTNNLVLPATTLADNCYYAMFYGCAKLLTVPMLPATSLSQDCYHSMFEGCTSLTTPPQLPATTLASNCYQRMFYGCTSLTTAPSLQATTLANACYYDMFNGCKSLTLAPTLPAQTLTSECYRNMFSGCNKLTTPPALPATTLASSCYQYMFYGCTSLTTAPSLQATTLANACYDGMFKNCTSLTTAPVLPATTLTDYCYRDMFYGCCNISYIKALMSTLESYHATDNWVFCVGGNGTFVKNQSLSESRGISAIPEGWVVENN